MPHAENDHPERALPFRIRYCGAIAPAWAAIVQDMAASPIQTATGTESVIRGAVPDEAALIGLVNLLHELGCALVSVDVQAPGMPPDPLRGW
jgi:hypothetical protein